MKVGVGDGCVPANNDIVANPQLDLAEKHCICEITIITNGHRPFGPNGKMYTVHSAVVANHDCVRFLAKKPFESVIRRNARVLSDAHVGWQAPVGPAAGYFWLPLAHSCDGGCVVFPNCSR